MRMGSSEIRDTLGDWHADPLGKPRQLADAMRHALADGRLPLGARLPGERPLAIALGVSRATVVEALGSLRAQGWVTTRHGSGSVTRLPPDHEIRTEPTSLRCGGSLRNLAQAMPAAPLHDMRAALQALGGPLRHELVDTGHHPAGLAELRTKIAGLLSADDLPTEADQLLITNGAMDALAAALRLGTSGRRPRVVVEAPTYPGALATLANRSAGVIPWSTPHLPETLGPQLGQHRPDAIFIVADGHNPTGVIRSAAWRDHVARHARHHAVRLVVDHTLRSLDLRDEPGNEPPVAAFATDALVVGSFAKVIWGGLRVGWLRARQAEIAYLTGLDLGTASLIDQLLLTHLLDHHDRYVAQRRRHLAATRDAFVAGLPTDQLELAHIPQGGIAVWLELTAGSATALAQRAATDGLLLAPGPLFHADRRGDRHLRLPLTLDADAVPDTIARLDDLARRR
jgi:DNA-binding transcriptional MocR family regulator